MAATTLGSVPEDSERRTCSAPVLTGSSTTVAARIRSVRVGRSAAACSGPTMSDQIMQALDEMQARCDAATEGPWTATYDDADRWTCITGQGHDLGGGL